MAAAKSKPPNRKRSKRNILPLALATGAAGTALAADALPGTMKYYRDTAKKYWRDSKGVLHDATAKGREIVSRLRGNPEDIELLNELAPETSIGHVRFTPEGLEEFVRDGFIYHAYANTPVFEDGYRMGTPVREAAGYVNPRRNPLEDGAEEFAMGWNDGWRFVRTLKENQVFFSFVPDKQAQVIRFAVHPGENWHKTVDLLQMFEQSLENPAKFDRCVRDVKTSAKRYGRPVNAYAVCTAAGTRNPSAAYQAGFNALTSATARLGTTNLSPSMAQREEWRHSWGDYMRGWNEAKKRKYANPRRNPAAESDALYETFHGAPPTETLEIEEEEHVHEHLAGLGELVQLIVKLEGGTKKGDKLELDAPDPETSKPEDIVHLASNEDATQLYFVGGDQSLDLEALGFRESFTMKHEGEAFDVTDIRDLMTIGRILKLTYRTQKAFDKFELVDYFHKAGEDSKEKPMLLYDVPNRTMKIAGGEYIVHAKGVIN